MYKLINGDCLKEMKKIKSGVIDLVLADPPYGTTACKWDSVIPFDLMWEQLKRVIKPKGAIIMTASQPFTSALIMSNTKMFKYCWSWKKSNLTNFLNAKKQPLRCIEDIALFCHGQSTYNPIMTPGERKRSKRVGTKTSIYGKADKETIYDSSERYPKQLIEIPNRKEGKLHPTQKPVALMEYLIKTYTNEGEVVLDFAMGSGTTGVACQNLNRTFIGIEKDPEYFKVAENRMKEAI
ncbi:MAG: site-specific DNA-methyltransferase [Deltaproteobacteria bacterium]|nr:site-specific DNA-methyltransferase [Deltaproteobacteria bacterium]